MVTIKAEHGVEAMRIMNPLLTPSTDYDDYDVFTARLADFLAEADQAGLADRLKGWQRRNTHRL